jgi:acyl-coenzyme A synthetase/AMP-(fatty) acid ligase
MSAFHLQDLLIQAAARFPERTFLFQDETVLTFSEAELRVDQIASGMLSRGIRAGDRVLLVMENRIELPLLTLAAIRIGAVFSVLTARITAESFQKIVHQCEPTLVVLEARRPELREGLSGAVVWLDGVPVGHAAVDHCYQTLAQNERADIPCSAGGDALAFLVFTSGSTGMPRGVMLSHANVGFVTKAIMQRLDYQPQDRLALLLPMSFDYGFYQIFYALLSGCAVFVGRSEMSGPELPRVLARHEITILPGVPTLFAGLLKMQSYRPVPLPQLRLLSNTGDHLPLPHIRQLQALFPAAKVFPMYGLTECKRVSILLPEEIDAHENSVGRALNGTEVWAESPEGLRLPPGEVGEFIVKGPNVGLGYWRAPEETAKRYRQLADGSRLLVTGDYGAVDADGFLYFHARSDFMIKHRGHRMSPVEIEEAACRSPRIAAAGCIKDEAKNTLCLFLVCHGDPPEDAVLSGELALHLELAKLPDRLIYLAELPRTANQKVDRKALRALLAQEA